MPVHSTAPARRARRCRRHIQATSAVRLRFGRAQGARGLLEVQSRRRRRPHRKDRPLARREDGVEDVDAEHPQVRDREVPCGRRVRAQQREKIEPRLFANLERLFAAKAPEEEVRRDEMLQIPLAPRLYARATERRRRRGEGRRNGGEGRTRAVLSRRERLGAGLANEVLRERDTV